ncbi:MAG: alanine acetyltransferase [Afipia sp.]|nr:alanine acetyltransferase [Afipia sp.]
MKALVYHGPASKSVEEHPKPKIQAPGDAIIKMVKTTICGTDLLCVPKTLSELMT